MQFPRGNRPILIFFLSQNNVALAHFLNAFSIPSLRLIRDLAHPDLASGGACVLLIHVFFRVSLADIEAAPNCIVLEAVRGLLQCGKGLSDGDALTVDIWLHMVLVFFRFDVGHHLFFGILEGGHQKVSLRSGDLQFFLGLEQRGGEQAWGNHVVVKCDLVQGP